MRPYLITSFFIRRCRKINPNFCTYWRINSITIENKNDSLCFGLVPILKAFFQYMGWDCLLFIMMGHCKVSLESGHRVLFAALTCFTVSFALRGFYHLNHVVNSTDFCRTFFLLAQFELSDKIQCYVCWKRNLE